MSDPDVERLRSIKTFPSLVKYLRDELDWPIETENFEELYFEYEAEELGIDAKNAAKVKEIKQLRPLESKQPWGVFFVMFEPKRLPVVALRRILRSLVKKKRASAARAQQATWQLHDLLFISSYGESEHRDITFAHFSEDPSVSDLPTLRVLGWDDENTALHLGHAHHTLKAKLRWPDDPDDLNTWRTSWSSAFVLRHREVITTSQQLAVRLADLARSIRKRVNAVLAVESEKGPLRKLMEAFQQALIHDLEDDDFADMYAQTIAYGLLSARVSRPAGLVADDVAQMVPITNPFLRELMEAFLTVGGRKDTIDFDELGVSEVVDVLREAKMEAVLRDFGDKNPQEDPVIHFYELFLKEYDAQKRMQRGVFYTPRPVVSFIVRSVDELLRTEFGLADGLADTTTWGEMAERFDDLEIPDGATPNQAFVQILDPATGTGTFLVEVIDVIHRTMVAKWKKLGHTEMFDIPELWNDYVPKHLLPRLHGYELMMAPYAIAHMKIGLKLYETGYSFESDERARVYLTNSLEPAQDFSGTFAFAIPALAHEAEAVNAIKRDQRFTVVIGNPPYSNFGQLNRIPFILNLLDDYKRDLDERKLNLDDDFIKFVRYAQHLIDISAYGVVGLISNNVFFDGITHRRMRESLMGSFGTIRVLDLHGSAKKLEVAPDGSSDENVFDITQGVGISIACKAILSESCRVFHSHLWGARVVKSERLATTSAASSQWTELELSPPHYFFTPWDVGVEEQEYEQGWSTKDIFRVNNDGIQTKRDRLTVQFTKAELREAVQAVRDFTPDALRSRYGLPADGRDWSVAWAKQDVTGEEGIIARVAYRPFDIRYTYYTGRSKGFLAYPRSIISDHLFRGENLALAVNRFIKLTHINHFFVVRSLVDTHVLETANSCLNVSPLYLFPNGSDGMWTEAGKEPNLSAGFLAALADKLGLRPTRPHGLPEGVTPEDVFDYIYAVCHSPGYRKRYAQLLKIDFPRLPLPGNPRLFRELSSLGGQVVGAHILESAQPKAHITTLVGSGDFQVEKVSYSDETVWIDRAKTRGFRGVPEEVWNFHIGGYQVCNKWLKDRQAKGGKNPRPGRVLTDEDIDHYQKIVVALSETIRLMAEIDEVIDQHGGWPDAFVTGKDGDP